jgi:ectoine hydroxylase-related dioxygenase (phytanoyl-CoA dioxygenase family)
MTDKDLAVDVARLPALDASYEVPGEAVEAYRNDGHTVLRGVCSAEEIDAYGPVIKDAALEYSRETRPLEERDTYGKAFLQVPNLFLKDEAVARFVLAPRLAKIAADLMGVEGVRIYHDQALFKEAKGGRTPWHQDQYYWPLDTDHSITMWMPLVDVPAEVGSMLFASGSQRERSLGEHEISDESDEVFEGMLAEHGLKIDSHGAMRAGDATFHSGWILHAAPSNPTGILRAVMTIIYYADGVRIGKELTPARQVDLEKWLPGCEPGGLAATEINPVVWPPGPN